MGSSLAAESLLSLAVTVTSEQRVESVLQSIVQGLAAQPGMALARIWLLPSAGLPSFCRGVSGSLDDLSLVASAGTSINSPGEDWSFLQGQFARVPFNVGKVGQVAASRHPILVEDVAAQNDWIVRPEWAKREEIRSFAGYPLIFRDKLLGVIAVFSRQYLGQQEFTWLGLFANQAAVAIANACTEEALRSSERNLTAIINTIPTAAWTTRPDGYCDFINQVWLDYMGINAEKAQGWGWTAALHPDDRIGLLEYWRSVLASGKRGEIEGRLRRNDGAYRWFLFRAEPFCDENGKVVRWYGTNTDIEDLKQAEYLLAAEKHALEMIADGASLSDILNHVCTSMDLLVAPSMTTILLRDPDGKRLWHIAGPRVPREWVPIISPLPVALEAGLCGTAAFLKERIVVPDVATDPNWPDLLRPIAIRNGIRAGWSEPIVAKDRQVLGTFALYSPESRVPTDADLALIEGAGRIALIAIERQRSQEALRTALEEIRESERELRQIVDTIPGFVCTLSAAGEIEHLNRQTLEYFGKTAEELKNWTTGDAVHADDLPRVIEAWGHAVRTGEPYVMEFRQRRADGAYRWFQSRALPARDQEGRVNRWYMLLTDIDDRKKAEEARKLAEEALKDQLYKENLALRDEVERASMFDEIVGTSSLLKAVLSRIAKVAPTDSTVLITGETGTGKELIARAIHRKSRRAGRAFVSVNCAAIPRDLIPSELFGHEKGAFTGATQRRLGRFELADGGTIFLDEVGELLPDTQVALLRVLQERELERVGGGQPIHVDVRVIAATNRDLEAAVANGTFRQDLFYRLNVFPIEVPPLRERKDDLLLLVEYFVQRYSVKAGKEIHSIDKKTLDLLQSYDWPGNVRELQNVIERSVILTSGDVFSVDELWLSQRSVFPARPLKASPLTSRQFARGQVEPHSEQDIIEAALAATRGRVSGPSGAAAKLGIRASTLEARIKALKINKVQFKFR